MIYSRRKLFYDDHLCSCIIVVFLEIKNLSANVIDDLIRISIAIQFDESR